MRKRSRQTRQLLLEKEIVKILSTTEKVAGGAKIYPSDPPEECVNTSEALQMCIG